MKWYEAAFALVLMSAAAGCASLAKKVRRYCFFI